MIRKIFLTLLLLLPLLPAGAQSLGKYQYQSLDKNDEELQLFLRLRDVAYVDRVRLTGEPRRIPLESEAPFQDTLKDNRLIFYSYIFFPKSVRQGKRYPLIVFPHGGIHGTFATSYVHVLRELMAQGYIVVAPDYRGSTGYGKGFYEAIDYGGLENNDVLAARDYMVENYSVVDADRVGLLGWSHGGMISLMNVLQWPEKYTCAYAGVPVSDVTYRLSYQSKDYTKEFTVPYHVGASPEEAPEEYARRSPVSYASRLSKPLMLTTCLNDDDVSWTEVKRMIDALQAAGKSFEYEIYPKMRGAHLFERTDEKEATDIRFKTYRFLARYLKPAHPFKSVEDLRKAGYKYY